MNGRQNMLRAEEGQYNINYQTKRPVPWARGAQLRADGTVVQQSTAGAQQSSAPPLNSMPGPQMGQTGSPGSQHPPSPRTPSPGLSTICSTSGIGLRMQAAVGELAIHLSIHYIQSPFTTSLSQSLATCMSSECLLLLQFRSYVLID